MPIAESAGPANEEHPQDVDNTGRWSRRGGFRDVLNLALPMMVSTGCLTLTLLTDRTLLLYSSPGEMAACMAGGNLFWVLMCFPIGIVSMTSAFVAQYVGAGKPHKVGRMMWQAIWITLAISPVYLGLIFCSDIFFTSTGQSAELVGLQSKYLQILMLCATPGILESGLSGFFSGTGRTRIVMWVSVATCILNVLLDFALIFGMLGFPAMGIVGAGFATVISLWFKAALFFFLMLRQQERRQYGTWKRIGLDRRLACRFLFFGFPTGLQYVAESGGFLIVILQVGQISTEALSATTMAINFNMLAFVPLIGVSIATSVLVGQYLMQSGPVLAARAAKSAAILAVGYAFLWAIAFVAFPHQLLLLYQATTPDESVARSIATAAVLLRFVACYCVFDAVQIVISGALRGAGDTWFVLLATGVAAMGWMFSAIIFEGYATHMLFWWWSAMTAWVLTLAIFVTARFAQGRWKRLSLIR